MQTKFKRAFQWDLARQMKRVDFMLKWIPKYASTELNTVNNTAPVLSSASEKHPEAGCYCWQERTNWRALANQDPLGATGNKKRHYSQLAQKAPTPRKGFPIIDWSANQSWAEVCFDTLKPK